MQRVRRRKRPEKEGMDTKFQVRINLQEVDSHGKRQMLNRYQKRNRVI